jgi:porin
MGPRWRTTLAAWLAVAWLGTSAAASQDGAPAPTRLDRLLDEADGQERPEPPLTPPPPLPGETPQASRFLFRDRTQALPALDERGLSLYVTNNQFHQGVASGGAEQAFRWGSKFEMLAHLDAERAGLWPGATIDLYAESRLGNSIDAFAGAYSPVNLAMHFPVPHEQITAITGLQLMQAISDEFGLFVGKLNALNGDPERFLRYPLTSQFWNAAFNFNLALDRYPYSAPGAGFYYDPEEGPSLAFLVLDGRDSPRTSGLANLGENGAFLYGEAKLKTSFLGLPGLQTLGGLYGTGRFADLDPSPFLNLPEGAPPKTRGVWTLLWHVEQRLWVDDDDPTRGLGLYIQNGLGDGNPNPVRYFLAAQLVGNVPGERRRGDTLGVGFYSLDLGSAVKTAFPGLRDERGVELFYNLRVAQGCHLTPDIQILEPGLGPLPTALVLGMRLKLDF